MTECPLFAPIKWLTTKELAKKYPPVSGWQPIETAPLDGTPVLIFRPTVFVDEQILMAEYSRYAEAWCIHIDGQHVKPTHWMPLPQAPTH